GKALSLEPDYVEAYHNLGIVFQDQGRHGEAVDSFQKVLEIRRDFVVVHRNLGESLQHLGRMEEAIGSYQRALEETPDVAEIHNNIGIAYKSLEQFEVAVVSFHKAIGLKPAYGEAHYNMAACLKSLDQLDAAIVCYRQALAINPNFADGYTNLGIALGECGLLDEAISCFQMVCQLEPTWAGAYSNMLMMEQYRPGHNAQSLLDLHRQWADRYGGHITRHPLPPVSAPDPDRALRIGFVSADLGRHPVGYFIVGLFEHLVKNDIETVVYSDRSADDLTDRIRNATDIWHDVQGMSDQQLGQMIVADEIDILFDLAGHLGTRLLVFAAKPAPLQVTWAGYIGTTGLPAMDYLLSDAHSTPAQEEQFYSEKIIRMADGWLCYSPPEYAPQVGPLPVRRNDSVTYGSFSNPVKINQDVVAVWSQSLARTENSRLFIKCKGGDSIGFKNRLLGMFEAHGIDPSRLLLEGRSPHAELLACYNKVDLALDPFPYSGGLTTYEALWMGVPVITLPGDTFASRHSASHLMTLGLPELVAAGPQQYVELAVGLANDTDRLAALRADLRQMMASSPICDYQKFARGF
ncbi:MAG TPA: tetratricopeptide repeat protein, partial [Rhodospirillales bacterium]|nr:tetratricopeptide repeat protein [Rhodospirillales bacterium]